MCAKIYIAYGSNLNIRQMAMRCPGSVLVENGTIRDHELLFKGSPGNAHATIGEAEGGEVPAAIWKITGSDERNLDIYEGFPRHYRKKDIVACMHGGEDVAGMTYVMDAGMTYGIPSESYVDTVFRGYLDCGLSLEYLRNSVEKSAEKYAEGMMDRVFARYETQGVNETGAVLVQDGYADSEAGFGWIKW